MNINGPLMLPHHDGYKSEKDRKAGKAKVGSMKSRKQKIRKVK